MGNIASCIPLTSTSSASIKVIHSDGTIAHFTRPVRASELMLDHPGQFICNSDHLTVGCRVPGLLADNMLEPHHAYFLLPMDMLYSVLTDEEMAAISCRATGAAKWSNGGGGRPRNNIVRIVPVLGEFCLFPADVVTHVVEDHVGDVETGGGMRRQRSWQPALDTIEEVP